MENNNKELVKEIIDELSSLQKKYAELEKETAILAKEYLKDKNNPEIVKKLKKQETYYQIFAKKFAEINEKANMLEDDNNN